MEVLNLSQEYLQAAKIIKQAVLESRYLAARQVNKEIKFENLLNRQIPSADLDATDYNCRKRIHH